MTAAPGDERVRVLLVGQAAPARGGIPSFIAGVVADATLAAGADVRLLNTTRRAERRGGTLTAGHLLHATVDTWRTARAARDRDVVHVQTALLPVLPLLRALAVCAAARAAGAAVICHVHSAALNTGRAEGLAAARRARPLLPLLRWLTDRVLTVSEPGAALMRELVPGASVAAVDNAVDTASFPEARPSVEPPTAVYVGTLTRRKGLHDLAEAVHLLDGRGVHLPVVVVGGSNEVGREEAEEVRRAVATRQGDFTFLGSLPQREVRSTLAEAALFVLPSHEEGQPIAILEAMAAGLPVVVTTVGANPDVVRDGVEGFLVPPRDPARLADALERLVQDPALRARMGAAARERARTAFDREVLRSRLSGEYAAAVRARRSGRSRSGRAREPRARS